MRNVYIPTESARIPKSRIIGNWASFLGTAIVMAILIAGI